MTFLQNIIGPKYMFVELHSSEKHSENVPKSLGLHFVGAGDPVKIPPNFLQDGLTNIKKISPTSFCRRAGPLSLLQLAKCCTTHVRVVGNDLLRMKLFTPSGEYSE